MPVAPRHALLAVGAVVGAVIAVRVLTPPAAADDRKVLAKAGVSLDELRRSLQDLGSQQRAALASLGDGPGAPVQHQNLKAVLAQLREQQRKITAATQRRAAPASATPPPLPATPPRASAATPPPPVAKPPPVAQPPPATPAAVATPPPIQEPAFGTVDYYLARMASPPRGPPRAVPHAVPDVVSDVVSVPSSAAAAAPPAASRRPLTPTGPRRVAIEKCVASAVPISLGIPDLDKTCAESSTIGGMAPSQYRVLIKAILERRPTDMLVFSVGSDTPLWRRVNQGGYTTFVEDSLMWANQVRDMSPGVDINVLNYTIDFANCMTDAGLIAKGDADAVRRNDLPALRSKLASRVFRIIFVDGPMGMTGNKQAKHGRVQSAFTALLIACDVAATHGGTVTVFLHDCERPCEDEIARRVFDSRVARCQVWPPSELARDGRRAPSADVTLHRYEIGADHPTCQLPAVRQYLKSTAAADASP
eukprot:TRINITY_DN3021_c0_g3_i2.p1 TRINITY_DN3021_c0_g3~~TRINITY_DN3021_c0_g3_i2.p1  ORF type:complete len:497 (+),score=159.77 TRINITY_DN3021_c0_g3_i2:63-1493(+)